METAKGHKTTKTRRDSNYPTIKNFSRLAALQCSVAFGKHYRWSSYNSVTQTVPPKYNSICV